ncbi:MAG: hypothetical protein OEX98_09630 [Nitrosopumilus sp.]|nr:hypothetical protein [Nitrosopumilus sp.]
MKQKLFFFSCTAIEIMTVVGVTTYLLYLDEFILALISTIVFGKLIIFHFVMEYFDKQNLKKIQNILKH